MCGGRGMSVWWERDECVVGGMSVWWERDECVVGEG